MRIIAGKYKNKKIVTEIKGQRKQEFRPTASRTREAIFNLIEHSKHVPPSILEDAVVADIFCGCGTFGLEALSRGAGEVLFVNISPEQLKVVEKNIENIGERESTYCLRYDATQLPKALKACNIIYLDPPYHSNMPKKCLKGLAEQGWIADDHIVIVELDKREDIDLPSGFELLDTRKYGKTKLLLLEFIG